MDSHIHRQIKRKQTAAQFMDANEQMFIDILNDYELTTTEMMEKYGIGSRAIARFAEKHRIDMVARRIKMASIRSARSEPWNKKTPSRYSDEVVEFLRGEETMSGDMLSLEWLKKSW